MKLLLTTIILSFTFFSTAQNLKRIIDNNDLKSLKTYIKEVDYIDDEIIIPPNRYNNKTKVVISPLEYATLLNNFEMVKLLTKNQNKYEDFHDVVSRAFDVSLKNNNQTISNYLFNFNPNINEICSICEGNIPIMFAVKNGSKDWYFKLVNSSELNLINDDGNNLVHLSAEHYNDDVFNDILNKGVDINLSNKNKKTPLQVAALNGANKMFYRLIDNSANYETIDELYADAILGGNLNIINYFDKEDMFETDFLWFTSDYEINNEKPRSYYPFELAILSKNPKVLTDVVSKMMTNIEKDSTNEHIKLTYELLSGSGDDFDHISLTHTIAMGYKEMFETILINAVEFNKRHYNITYQASNGNYTYEQEAKVYFTKFDFRAAKRQFGKDYVTNLYKDLGIKF
jgi:ankyrin repeat protein